MSNGNGTNGGGKIAKHVGTGLAGASLVSVLAVWAQLAEPIKYDVKTLQDDMAKRATLIDVTRLREELEGHHTPERLAEVLGKLQVIEQQFAVVRADQASIAKRSDAADEEMNRRLGALERDVRHLVQDVPRLQERVKALEGRRVP